MVENQPKPQAKNKITLIVVPSSIVDQWVDELATHTEFGTLGSIIVHRSSSHLNVADQVRYLKGFQVIITTYHEVGLICLALCQSCQG